MRPRVPMRSEGDKESMISSGSTSFRHGFEITLDAIEEGLAEMEREEIGDE